MSWTTFSNKLRNIKFLKRILNIKTNKQKSMWQWRGEVLTSTLAPTWKQQELMKMMLNYRH